MRKRHHCALNAQTLVTVTSGSVWCVVVAASTVRHRRRGTGSATSAMPAHRRTPTGTSTNRTTPTRTSTARRCCGSSAGGGTTRTATMATPATSVRPRRLHDFDLIPWPTSVVEQFIAAAVRLDLITACLYFYSSTWAGQVQRRWNNTSLSSEPCTTDRSVENFAQAHTKCDQGHREFPFWKRKIPPAKEKIPENSRSVKCLILHALTQ